MNSTERKRIGVTRRDFIKGTAAGAVGGLVVGAAGPVLSAGSTSKPQTRGSAGRGFYRGLSAEIVQMRGHEGDMIEAYLAHPAGSGSYPGVVVIHHMPGWDEATMEITRKFAHHGYVAICPDLQFREGKATPAANSASVREAGGMPDNRCMGDVEAASAICAPFPISTARWASSGTAPEAGRSTWPPARSKGSMPRSPAIRAV